MIYNIQIFHQNINNLFEMLFLLKRKKNIFENIFDSITFAQNITFNLCYKYFKRNIRYLTTLFYVLDDDSILLKNQNIDKYFILFHIPTHKKIDEFIFRWNFFTIF